ncbi:hypothetical protein FRB93_000340 [Tulasnella sp. JGI-2019a]|nr:hypothetical protein FRB93_000340 [Tulasnella sp. JGI-2019a]
MSLLPELEIPAPVIDPSADPKVYFDPPLWLQRRTWVLDQLRKHQVRSIIELGCGEGALLEVLMEPASSFPTESPPGQDLGAQNERETTMDIHLEHYVGLDVDPPSIAQAAEVGRPLTEAEIQKMNPWSRPSTRWLSMDVELWEGGLQFLNSDVAKGAREGWFGRKQWDAIVSAEVVEHLPEDVLDCFLPVTLGVYRPEFLFLTTPNYNFNQLFSHPDRPNRASGYPDPTGATDRVFRHHDHKREWTEVEWLSWCHDGAEAWCYEVEVGGIGQAEEKDPWSRTAAAGKASLTAAFRRRPGGIATNVLEKCSRALSDAYNRSTNQTQHKLILRHRYLAHEWAGQPRSSKMILGALRDVMQDGGELGFKEGTTMIDEVWLRGDVASACGGMIQALFDAVSHYHGQGKEATSSSEWILNREIEAGTHIWRERFWSWSIVWRAFIKAEPGNNEEAAAEPTAEDWNPSQDDFDNGADPEEWQPDPEIADGGWSDGDVGGWAGASWGGTEDCVTTDWDMNDWDTTPWGTVDPAWV